MAGKIKTREIANGSMVIGEAVRAANPGVVAAFPITPQTHIVEHLGHMIADGKLDSEYVLGDSEFSVASVLYGASVAGVRSYTATASQGFLLMHEVLFNMAGTRLPTVFTAVNRSLSPPINIQLDHQDTMSLRDPGLIQIYVENMQEAYNTHIQAFRIAEHNDVMLPVLVCTDGFILTHAYEPVTFLEDEAIRDFIPDFNPQYKADSKNPLTWGSHADDDKIMEFRYMVDQALSNSKKVITEVAEDFRDRFGMFNGALVEEYKTDDAEIIIVGMGSMVSTIKAAIDIIREEQGVKVGLLKVRSYRPFPGAEIAKCLKKAEVAAVLDRSVSFGIGGILGSEIKSHLYNEKDVPPVISYIAGLGGREINVEAVRKLVADIQNRMDKDALPLDSVYFDLNEDLIP
ncbi:MAG: transketolase C-terminal domain-containing protein [Halanaerobium sp.]|nr:transketolase C-terminal domain-containing protein [Halanaerobium sp.]